MPKIKYVGPHSRYTVADIAFEKDKTVELANDQVAKLKANGVGTKLFANGYLVAEMVGEKLESIKNVARKSKKHPFNSF